MGELFSDMDLWIGLFGGLALFLYGMDLLTRALKRVAGDQMKVILERLTGNRFLGVGLGAFVTSVVQSSSVTTVLMVGFISAGVMTLAQSIPVIMGANIGTTITAQILAFKVSALALPMVSLGVLLMLAAKSRMVQEYGTALLGLGLVFYGMSVMSGAMSPLRDHEPFIAFMTTLKNPLLAAAIGAGFTAVVQSSSATTGILIVLASQGLIGLDAAIGIALGANVGTCVTALLAAIGKPREAVRAALAHTLFNLAGVVLWIGFIPQLSELSRALSPAFPELSSAARRAAEVPRQIANAHTLFNVINTLLMIGFTAHLARIVEWMLPDRPARIEPEHRPKYLDRNLIDTPPFALEAARREIGRIGKRVVGMVDAAVPVAIEGPRMKIDQLTDRDRAVDALHEAVIEYLGEISLRRLSRRQSEQLVGLIGVANDLEQIADLVARDVVDSSQKRLDDGVVVSPATARIIKRFHAEVVAALKGAVEAFVDADASRASVVREMKGALRELNHELALHEIERLTAKAPRRVKTYTREVELIEILDDIFRLARRIARSQLTEDAQAGADKAEEMDEDD
jgi:phosphate:Na+ symporter